MRPKRTWPKTPYEWWGVIQVAVVLAALRLCIPRLKLKTLLGILEPTRIASRVDTARFERITRYVAVLLRRWPLPLSGQCLPRALALYYFATRCGLPVRFHCGVAKTGASLQGHAWLSLHGQAFLEGEPPETHYIETFSFVNGNGFQRGPVTSVHGTDGHHTE